MVLLTACASFSPDNGFDSVKNAVNQRTSAEPRWARTDAERGEVRQAVTSLLGQPLTADAAVQIALMNNRGLQATYSDLGIAEADLVQAGRLPNPRFAFERLVRGDELEIGRAFIVNVLSLLTMPARTQIEQRRFAVAKTRVAGEAARVAADTRRAWYSAVAAQEGVKYMQQVKDAAEASAELAQRMARAGNFSKLDQAREQVFYAETTAQLARVSQAAVAERENLTRLMGLWGEHIRFTLPERLPDLPKAPQQLEQAESDALRQRLDVQAAMQEAESVASSLGLTRVTGFISLLEVGYQHNSETGKPPQKGFEVELRLPIFDTGNARVVRAQHTYMQAVERAAELAVRARSEVREATNGYRTTYDLARHYRDEIVPLRKRISDENVLRYNGMLISVFELLADARQQVASVNAYIEALRDFWIADANLRSALTATSPGATTVSRRTSAPSEATAAGH
ncbi:MAG TPA: TolC family protein [Burkholderiales bacterium]|nr:TolC family protein [Burkholderiales bacterium]